MKYLLFLLVLVVSSCTTTKNLFDTTKELLGNPEVVLINDLPIVYTAEFGEVLVDTLIKGSKISYTPKDNYFSCSCGGMEFVLSASEIDFLETTQKKHPELVEKYVKELPINRNKKAVILTLRDLHIPIMKKNFRQTAEVYFTHGDSLTRATMTNKMYFTLSRIEGGIAYGFVTKMGESLKLGGIPAVGSDELEFLYGNSVNVLLLEEDYKELTPII